MEGKKDNLVYTRSVLTKFYFPRSSSAKGKWAYAPLVEFNSTTLTVFDLQPKIFAGKHNFRTIRLLFKPYRGLCKMSEKLVKFFNKKSVKYSIPFLVLVVGGSFGLKHFTENRQANFPFVVEPDFLCLIVYNKL